MIVQYPGQRIFAIPGEGWGIEFQRRWDAGVVTTPWYLSGGIPAVNCIIAYQPKGAANIAASYINLANPGTYDAAPGVAPSWLAASGWTFDGVAQFLTTGGFIPAAGYSMFSQFAAFTQKDEGVTIGSYAAAGAPYFFLSPAAASVNAAFYGNGLSGSAAPRYLSGNIGVAGQKAYRNGVDEGIILGPWAGIAQEPHIGALNKGISHVFTVVTVVAIAIYDTALTAPQVTALTAAMAAL